MTDFNKPVSEMVVNPTAREETHSFLNHLREVVANAYHVKHWNLSPGPRVAIHPEQVNVVWFKGLPGKGFKAIIEFAFDKGEYHLFQFSDAGTDLEAALIAADQEGISELFANASRNEEPTEKE